MEKKKMNIDGRNITEYIHKKVTNTVGTIFANENDGFLLSYTELKSEKVADMVGTFLNDESDGFTLSDIKVESEKVASTVATFFDQGYQFL